MTTKNAGLLVAQTGNWVALSQLVWFDRRGDEVGAVGEPGVFGSVSIAPNGKSVAVERPTWEARRLTFGLMNCSAIAQGDLLSTRPTTERQSGDQMPRGWYSPPIAKSATIYT